MVSNCDIQIDPYQLWHIKGPRLTWHCGGYSNKKTYKKQLQYVTRGVKKGDIITMKLWQWYQFVPVQLSTATLQFGNDKRTPVLHLTQVKFTALGNIHFKVVCSPCGKIFERCNHLLDNHWHYCMLLEHTYWHYIPMQWHHLEEPFRRPWHQDTYRVFLSNRVALERTCRWQILPLVVCCLYIKHCQHTR